MLQLSDAPSWRALGRKAEALLDSLQSLSRSHDEATFAKLEANVYSCGDIIDCAPAIAPHLVAFAEHLSEEQQIPYWRLLGSIVLWGDEFAVPDRVRNPFDIAVARARPLVLRCLVAESWSRITALELLWTLVGVLGARRVGKKPVRSCTCERKRSVPRRRMPTL